jgi:hypothetical protein
VPVGWKARAVGFKAVPLLPLLAAVSGRTAPGAMAVVATSIGMMYLSGGSLAGKLFVERKTKGAGTRWILFCSLRYLGADCSQFLLIGIDPRAPSRPPAFRGRKTTRHAADRGPRL